MTETASTNTNVVNFDEQIRKELAGLKDTLPPPASNKIKTKGKLFTLPGGQSNPGPMQVCVLDYAQANEHYPGAYNAKNPQKPICFSVGKVIKELKPSATAPAPQAAECAGCPKNQFGSATNGGQGKACKNTYKLMIVQEDFHEKSTPLAIFVSPAGMKHWSRYVAELAKDHGMLPVQVITQISFDPQETYPTLLFEYVKPHGQVSLAMGLRAKHQDILLREPEADAPPVAKAA